MKTFIAIATHKKYQMPIFDIYKPIEVGAEGKQRELGYLQDNTLENISNKNANYCELTALYWLWKNDDSAYKGLVHYRRHFSKLKNFSDFRTGNFKNVLDEKTLQEFLKESDIIVPKLRKYYIETNYSHYAHAHNSKDLDLTREIISEIYPEYLNAFDEVMQRRSAHMFNMFIMKKEYFDAYCKWLFDILFELEKRVDISQYDSYEARIFGFISELLLDVWLLKNDYKYKEVPVMFMEKQNWFSKGGKFLMRKFKRK